MSSTIAEQSRTITSEHTVELHDAIIRAVDNGWTVALAPESFTFGDRTYWTLVGVGEPNAQHLVMVEQVDERVVVWCECAEFASGVVCSHIALALDEMRLIPTTTGDEKGQHATL